MTKHCVEDALYLHDQFAQTAKVTAHFGDEAEEGSHGSL
jgi:hypothetical protein